MIPSDLGERGVLELRIRYERAVFVKEMVKTSAVLHEATPACRPPSDGGSGVHIGRAARLEWEAEAFG
jgi:hypothetical protein